MPTAPSLKHALRVMQQYLNTPASWPYRRLYDFVLKHGKIYVPQDLPKKYHRGRQKLCFKNSLMLAVKEKLTYVEGYALALGTHLIHHAWCVEPGSKRVLDVTWREGHGCAYFGVAFHTIFAGRFACEFGLPLIGSWKQDFPLLRGLIPESAWRTNGEAFHPEKLVLK